MPAIVNYIPKPPATATIPATIGKIIDAQKAAHLTDPAPSAAVRADRLARCMALLRDNRPAMVAALNEDFGNRHEFVSFMADIMAPITALKYARKNLRQWIRPNKRAAALPFHFLSASARVHYQPLGCVGHIMSWHAPFHTGFAPLASIFAAGNRCVLKPSEYTPASAALMQELVQRYFDETELAVILGGAKIGAAFSKMPFDHLLFTGGSATGAHIVKASAENLTPLTLALGGKSPVIISDSADIERAAWRIMTAKASNAGQMCYAPDYVLVSAGQHDALVEKLRYAAAQLYPTIKDNDDVTSIINQRHYNRLKRYLDDARKKGGAIIEINPEEENFTRMAGRKMPLTLILNPRDDMLVMQEEIFGPLLPIKICESVAASMDYVNTRPRPLALYYFGRDKEEENDILHGTISGTVCVNDVASSFAPSLPIGGVGASGYGVQGGYEGFCNFSHTKGVYRQMRHDALAALLRPPYRKKFLKQLIRLSAHFS